jgi:uncharacterized RDD family membrane protein YckC
MTDQELQKNRFIAMGIDVGIAIAIGVVFSILGIVAGFINSVLGGLVQVAGAAIMCGYILLRDFLLKGNSIGKHVMKIKVVNTAGAPIDMMQSIKRNVVFALTSVLWLISSIVGMIPILGCIAGILLWVLQIIVGLAVLAFVVWEIITITKDPNGIRWGDKTAGTMVVKQ